MFSARQGFQGGIAGDPYWNSVQMLITARTGTTVDATGKASITTAPTVYSSPVKYNPYSFGQASTNSPWTIAAYSPRTASGLFTFEWWWRSVGTSATTPFEVGWIIGVLVGQIGTVNSNRWTINVSSNLYNMTTANVYDQQWHHVCWTRNASNVNNLYFDGVQSATTVPDTTWSFGSALTFNGAGGGDNYSNSYWDDIRLTVGVCRYTGNFTPPVGPLPTSL